MPSARYNALIAGWFSYVNGHATGGDLLARDVLCEWLDSLAIQHVTAVAPPFTGGPKLDEVDPAEFSHAFFVCGPFGRGPMEEEFLTRFARCRLIGLNLSADLDPDEWQPFDLLLERDSDRTANPDLVFASRNDLPPVVGVCLVESHPQVDVDAANRAIAGLLDRHEAARVAIDTRLDVDDTSLRTKGEIEAVIGRLDMMVTTRLHGVVLALKNEVPAIAVDAVPGGGKVSRQCMRIGWPNVLTLDELDDSRLDHAFDFALSKRARALARECSERAVAGVERVKAALAEELCGRGLLERNYAERQTEDGMGDFLDLVAASPAVSVSFPVRLRRRLRRLLGSGRAA